MNNKAEQLYAALISAKKSGFIKDMAQAFDYIFLYGFINITEHDCYKHKMKHYTFSDYSQIQVADNGFVSIFKPEEQTRLFAS